MDETPYLDGREHLIEKYGYLPFMGSRNPKYISNLLKVSKLKRFDKGEKITEEGEYDNWSFILLSGEVTVTKMGKEIAVLDQPGESFGELVLIDYQARSATVEASKETFCLAIDGTKVELIVDKDRDKFFNVLFRSLAETLATRLRETSAELIKVKKELEKKQES